MKVIIAGSRGLSDYELVKLHLDTICLNQPDISIVSGTAQGADRLGEQYANDRGYTIHRYPADWDSHHKSAGVIRNHIMARIADIAIIFWDGKSKGSRHMISAMQKLEKPCFVILYNTKSS